MEDDLRHTQAVASRELRFKTQRESAKIMPGLDAGDGVEHVPARAAPAVKPGFFNKIKGIFKKEEQLIEKAVKPAVETKPPFVSKAPVAKTPAPIAPVINKPASHPLGTGPVPSKEPVSKPGAVPIPIAKMGVEPAVPTPAPVQPAHPVQKSPLPTQKPAVPVAVPEEKKVQGPPPKQLTITKEEAEEIISKRKELKKEETEIEKKLEDFEPEKKPFETKIEELQKAKKAIQAILIPILEKEKKLEAEEKSIESQEAKAESIQARHKLEQKRWSVERQRRKAEHQKWVEEEKIELKNNEIAKIEEKLEVILNKESGLKKRKHEILQKLEQAELFETRAKFGESKKTLEKQLSLLTAKEKEVEQKEKTLEQKEQRAKTTQDRRVVEKQRWEIETQRRKIEQKRWQVEKKKQELQEEVEIILPLKVEKPPEPKLPAPGEPPLKKPSAMAPVVPEAKILAKEPVKEDVIPLRRRAKEWKPVKHLDTPGSAGEEEALRPKQEPRAPLKSAVEIPLADMSEEELVERIRQGAKQEEKRKKIQIIKKSAQVQKKDTYVPKSKGPISKAQILQKLSTISPKEKASRESFLSRVAGKPQPIAAAHRGEEGEVVFRPVVRRSSVWQKIAARVMFLVLIVGVLVVVALLLHTYVFSREPLPPPPPIPPVEPPVATSTEPIATSTEPEPEPEPATTTEPVATSTEPIATSTPPVATSTEPEPVSLIDVSETQTLWLSPIDTISDLLSGALEDNKAKEGFVRIVFRDERTKKIQEFENFLRAFNVDEPTGFLQGLMMPPTLFIYSSGGKARFGFIARVGDSGALIDSLKLWESSMEADTEELFSALGKISPAISSKFITARHGSEGFRYQTFTKEDFGACYAVTYSNYFIFATSYEAMQKTLDNLANQ